MKKLLLLPLIITFFNVKAQTTAIPDTVFEQALINLGLDSGSIDGVILTANIDTVTSLYVGGDSIVDMTGIEDFVSLISLRCQYNRITNLNVTQNTFLTELMCFNNQLSSLDVTQNSELKDLFCYFNQITVLDLTQNYYLEKLNCYYNQLTNLDLTQNTALKYLNCCWNQFPTLDVTQNTALTVILVQFTPITSLDVSQNINLDTLYCQMNQLTDLDVSQNINLTQLSAHTNSLNCLNVKNGNNINMTYFEASINPALSCVEVDNAAYSISNWANNVDIGVSYSTSCPNPCLVGIDKLSSTTIKIYPNPTTGNITIDLGEVKTNIQATITNSIGQVVLTQNLGSTSFINLDLESSSGIYFLQIEADGEIITKKIIKQ